MDRNLFHYNFVHLNFVIGFITSEALFKFYHC